VGSPEKAKAVKALGADPILYKTEDFATMVKEKTGGNGVDVILDPVGATYLTKDIDSLKVGGRIVLIGLMGGKDSTIDLGLVLRKRVQLIGSTLRGLSLPEKREAVERFRKSCFQRFESGELKPIIDKVYPAADVREAHKHMEQNKNIGKILLSWE
jgi:NADPH:quinone reductase-like Zn-dependent oxidoreductase